MDNLADARVVLNLALKRLPDSDHTIKERIETNLQQIDSTRLRVLKTLVYDDGNASTAKMGGP